MERGGNPYMETLKLILALVLFSIAVYALISLTYTFNLSDMLRY